MEAAEPRSARSQLDPEAGAPLVQVHRMHGDLQYVQTVRESRLLGPQRGRQTRHRQDQGRRAG